MGHDLALRAAVLLILAGGVGASAWMRRRADRHGRKVPRSADPPATAWALRVGGSVFYGMLVLWIVAPPTTAWAQVELPPALRWAGVLLSAAGVWLGLWALAHLGRNVTPTSAVRADAELVTSGPYGRVRHPLYASGLLSVPGLAIASANVAVLAVGAAAYVVLALRTRREEEKLVERFGRRYVDYMARTGRFLPRLRRGSPNPRSAKP